MFDFLRLGAVPEEDTTDPELETEAGTGDDTLDDLLEVVEPEKQDAKGDDEDPVKKAETRAEKAERELAEERATRRRLEERAQPAPVATRDTDADAEDEQLRAAKARGEETKWLEWQIDTNRKIRANLREARTSRSAGEDALDLARFEKLEITKPKTFKRYAPQVEQAIADFRKNGQNPPPRMLVLTMLVGKDVMDGKVNSTSKKKPAAASEPAAKGVERGRSAVVRSDVSGKQKQNERDARRARLENQPI